MSLLPANRPQQTAAATLALLAAAKLDPNQVLVIGQRGYFRDSMGKPGVNDRGLYDDAFIVHSPRTHRAFNGNTDPSVGRPGMAVLKPGAWKYQPGIHGLSHPVGPRRYPAFVQTGPVTVHRDGGSDDTGFFGINIHHGGEVGTSSLGCQTVPPEQWDEFHSLVLEDLRYYGQHSFTYLLVEHQG